MIFGIKKMKDGPHVLYVFSLFLPLIKTTRFLVYVTLHVTPTRRDGGLLLKQKIDTGDDVRNWYD